MKSGDFDILRWFDMYVSSVGRLGLIGKAYQLFVKEKEVLMREVGSDQMFLFYVGLLAEGLKEEAGEVCRLIGESSRNDRGYVLNQFDRVREFGSDLVERVENYK